MWRMKKMELKDIEKKVAELEVALIIITIFLALSLVGVFFATSDDTTSEVMIDVDNNTSFCFAQVDNIILQGFHTNLTKSNTEQILDNCCCMGIQGQAMCVCDDKFLTEKEYLEEQLKELKDE